MDLATNKYVRITDPYTLLGRLYTIFFLPTEACDIPQRPSANVIVFTKMDVKDTGIACAKTNAHVCFKEPRYSKTSKAKEMEISLCINEKDDKSVEQKQTINAFFFFRLCFLFRLLGRNILRWERGFANCCLGRRPKQTSARRPSKLREIAGTQVREGRVGEKCKSNDRPPRFRRTLMEKKKTSF